MPGERLARSIKLPPVGWATAVSIPREVMRLVLLMALCGAVALLFACSDRHRLIIFIAIGIASILSSLAGFAFSAICGAFLFHIGDNPVQVVEVMITCSIANQAAMTWALRRDIEWWPLSGFLVAGAVGLPIGVWVLLHADRLFYMRAVGLLLLVYGSYMLLRKPVAARQHAVFDVLVGFLGGVTGGALGFPGASVTIWCSMKGWTKDRQRAVFQPFILLIQIAALVMISLWRTSDATSVGYDPLNLLYIPSGLLGTAIGIAWYQRLSDVQFARAVNLFLIIAGVSFIV